LDLDLKRSLVLAAVGIAILATELLPPGCWLNRALASLSDTRDDADGGE
jgi:hypothetical protein